MPDLFATITEADPALVTRWTTLLEVRAASPVQRAMLHSYLADLPFPQGARVLEVGCGTGAVTRVLAQWPGVGEAVGVDPSPIFIAKAQELGGEIGNLSFVEGDGRALALDDAQFDVVVFHTTLCHVPEPEKMIAEAFRVLCPGGYLSVFDGDYAATSYAIGPLDPMQAASDAIQTSAVHDMWLVRRLTALVQEQGFRIARALQTHGWVETAEPTYSLGVLDMGIDTLTQAGRIGGETAEALKREARRRVGTGQFFASRTYGSLIAQKAG